MKQYDIIFASSCPSAGHARLASNGDREPELRSAWSIASTWIPWTRSSRTRAKLSSRPGIPLLYLVSGVALVCTLLIQFFGSRNTLPGPPSVSPEESKQTLSPFGDSVYRQEAYYERLEPGTQCKPTPFFSAELPVTDALTNMALEAEAKRLAAQFEYTKEDVNRGVKEFMRQMAEGLAKQGTTLSQIPTYVTAVPNGTEKVGGAMGGWVHCCLTIVGRLSGRRPRWH